MENPDKYDLKQMIESAALLPHDHVLTFTDLREQVIHELLHPNQCVRARGASARERRSGTTGSSSPVCCAPLLRAVEHFLGPFLGAAAAPSLRSLANAKELLLFLAQNLLAR
jgi:hypothetical protein